MHRTTPPSDGYKELARKRDRNRLAQQKYRRKLKSRIEDLEKRAAVADRLAKANNAQSSSTPGGDMSSFATFPTQIGGQGGFTSLPASTNACSPQSRTPVAVAVDLEASSASPITASSSLSSQAASDMSKDSDFVKAFSLSDDASWTCQKNLLFQDTENLDRNSDIHIDTGDSAEPLRVTRNRSRSSETLFSQGLLGNSHASFQLPPIGEFSQPSLLPKPSSRPATASEPASLEARIEYVLRCLRTAGFEDPDSFVSYYYTCVFKDRSPVKLAQETSRIKGLPAVLEDLHTQASSWSAWEASRYRDTIVRSAANLIAEEFDRLARRKYSCEMELWQNISHTALPGAVATAGGGDGSGGGRGVHLLRFMAAELKRALRHEARLNLWLPVTMQVRLLSFILLIGEI
ncbi:hypothetical protein DL766_010215 [Monosporascus sp. MC13-8B]|uniref:BZIP domain-containing protein n=1 Tax=Monosporascus cannonballus TaxID=155416 RepID=A0ABY0H5G1_9PEZI|nr:hypothetical protein DL762_006853 [Monosporascus cannonballus]RYO84966.1 hypothetical protein DL763_007278 [Monosporascus cannonballus]RYP07360.1 hypothetical protein DL766_010215 [Monosporascus sp. MC13-8B]